jgi:hypothetical protein
MSFEEAVQGFSEMIADDDPIESVVLTCALCHEPGAMVNGILVHAFTGRPQCTYRSFL